MDGEPLRLWASLLRSADPPGSEFRVLRRPPLCSLRPMVGHSADYRGIPVQIREGVPIMEREPDKRAGTASKAARAFTGLGSMSSSLRHQYLGVGKPGLIRLSRTEEIAGSNPAAQTHHPRVFSIELL